MAKDWLTGTMFNDEVKKASGKTQDALDYSRAKTRDIMAEFRGELPQSIMRADKRSRGDADLATGSYAASAKHEGAFEISSYGCGNGALSAFPQNIGRAMLLLYTKRGDTVFDPFAGHNSRMELCVREGRHYIGCDICKRFMDFNRERAELLRKEFPEARIELHEMDSRRIIDMLPLAEQAQFTITSPPYYDIEEYGPEWQQLGKQEDYSAFLYGLTCAMRGNYANLESASFCVYFINDFRREGRFHAYHIDTFSRLQEVGFRPWDVMVVDFGTALGSAFPAQVVERKILPKRHEFAIIMRKPPWEGM